MKTTYKKIISGVVAAAAVALIPVASSSAWGPERQTFTNEKPADHVTFNSITDNAGLGDERNFVRVKEAGSSSDRSDSVLVEQGKTYEVYIYFHNNAASNYNLTAKNAKVYSYFPSIISAKNPGNVGATISADNASPASVWDEAKLMTNSATGIMMKYVENSAKIHSSGAVNMKTLSEDLFKVGGTFIGYDALDGNLPGCAEYSGYITYELKAEQAIATLSKTVSKDGDHFYDHVEATVGDVVTYKLTATNAGSMDLVDVVASDKLVEGLAATGKVTLTDNATGGKNVNVDLPDTFFSRGHNVGTLAEGGQGWTITYQAKITNEALGGAACGAAKLVNTAYIDYAVPSNPNLNGEIGNQAAVTVKVACPEDVVEMPKTGADAGEMVMTMLIVITAMGGTFYMVHGIRMMRREEQMQQPEQMPEE